MPSYIPRLNELETVAVRAYYDTYGKPTSDEERFYVQKGIEAMRFAVADMWKTQDLIKSATMEP